MRAADELAIPACAHFLRAHAFHADFAMCGEGGSATGQRPRPIVRAGASALTRKAIALALSVTACVTLASCDRQAHLSQPADYVAMGSSFAAGPGVGAREGGSPLLCARSADNYAHILARTNHLRLDDVSCSGATTDDVLSRRQARQRPQIEAVTQATRLVTITIGGNDVGYLGNLSARSCANDRALVPLLWRPILCKEMSPADVEAGFSRLPVQLSRIIAEIRKRAPGSRIVLTDYATVLPRSGTCASRAPLSAAEIASANHVADRLSKTIREAALRARVRFVAVSSLSQDHDVCSAEPWVNPFAFRSIPLLWGPAAYHPASPSMEATAAAIAENVRS